MEKFLHLVKNQNRRPDQHELQAATAGWQRQSWLLPCSFSTWQTVAGLKRSDGWNTLQAFEPLP